jgi:DNA-binding CsgD family transcriptional regulator/tetratricopeptide (TPR) repeat protein
MPRLVSSVLVDRGAELAALDAALARAASGEPAVALLAGEAGIGKTRLAGEAAARAEAAGALVLRGACVELGGEGLPFAPIVDALRALVQSVESERLDPLLGPSRADLARLLPQLDPVGPAQPLESGTTARLFDSLLGLVGRLAAEQPLVLLIEDLHWADRSTLDLLAFLVRALRDERVLVILTYRSDELHRRHPLRPLLAELDRQRRVERCELRRFDRAGVAAQLAGILGERPGDALVERVFVRSEGNAFLVEELVDLARDGGGDVLPESLRDVLLARTDRLSDAARHVLQVGAVGGRRVQHALLKAVADLPDGELDAALREAVEHHVLEVDGDAYAFRHALLRDAIDDDLLPGEGVRLHAAYAEALPAQPGASAGELAHHLYAAHDLAGALPVTLDAAREAAAAYAHAAAQGHLERALEVWSRVPDAEARTGTDRLGVLERAIRAAAYAGNEDRAVALIDQALGEVDRSAEPVRTALLLERRGFLVRSLGRDLGVGELREAVALLPPEPTRERAIVLSSLALALCQTSSESGVALAREAVAAARAAGARREEASALSSLGIALSYDGQLDEALATLDESRQIALETGEIDEMLRAYINLADANTSAGRHERAVDVAGEGIELARQHGFLRSRGAFLMGNQAESLMRLGRWREAERVLDDAMAIDVTGVHAASLGLIQAELAVAQGRYPEADEHAGAAARLIGDGSDLQYGIPLATVRAGSALGRGELDEASRLVAAGVVRCPLAGMSRYAWPLLWTGLRIEVARAARGLEQQEPPPADGASDALLALVESLPAVQPEEEAYQALAGAEAGRLSGASSSMVWSAVVKAWRRAGDPHLLAYSLLRLGEAQVAAGERDAAAAAVRESHALARELGAEPIVEEAAALARRARLTLAAAPSGNGAAPPGELSRDVAGLGLTAREVEVLRLVAAGRSNREIATELFISPKTASVHVSNILAKLQVSTRVQAAAMAHRLGLD